MAILYLKIHGYINDNKNMLRVAFGKDFLSFFSEFNTNWNGRTPTVF
jgi:hypothetical protein